MSIEDIPEGHMIDIDKYNKLKLFGKGTFIIGGDIQIVQFEHDKRYLITLADGRTALVKYDYYSVEQNHVFIALDNSSAGRIKIVHIEEAPADPEEGTATAQIISDSKNYFRR